MLEEAGHEVLVASDGQSAWRMIQMSHVPLVLTDWTMPGLDGPELCRRIRRLEGRPYTYVMILTARTSSPERVEGLRAGADDFLVKPLDRHELIARVEIARRILTMQADILARTAQAERLADELQLQNERLSELAWTDGLTGLCNRRRFLDALEAALSLASRRGLPLSIALLDVDRFKDYNDAFGHQAGDEVLRQLAEMLRANVRAHDLVARYGGEEFAVLLPDDRRRRGHRARRSPPPGDRLPTLAPPSRSPPASASPPPPPPPATRPVSSTTPTRPSTAPSTPAATASPTTTTPSPPRAGPESGPLRPLGMTPLAVGLW